MTQEQETKVKINTEKFGELEIEKSMIFNFVLPIIGFDEYKEYAIIDYKPDSPFKWLQSIENKDLAFPITLCSFFGIDYQFNIPDDEAQQLEIESADDVFVCNIVTIPSSNPEGATVNMLAPIVMNLANKKAMQIVLKDNKFEVRHKLFDKDKAESKEKEEVKEEVKAEEK